MKFMNDYDIAFARQRFGRGNTPNRLALAIMIERLAEWADENSDGWPYWAKPVRAAQTAITLVESSTNAENEYQERVDITDVHVAAAVKPVKAFLARQGVPAERKELILRSTRPLFVVRGQLMAATVTAIGLSASEREAFAALVRRKGWTDMDLRRFALRHIDQTGSKNPASIARWLMSQEGS